MGLLVGKKLSLLIFISVFSSMCLYSFWGISLHRSWTAARRATSGLVKPLADGPGPLLEGHGVRL